MNHEALASSIGQKGVFKNFALRFRDFITRFAQFTLLEQSWAPCAVQGFSPIEPQLTTVPSTLQVSLQLLLFPVICPAGISPEDSHPRGPDETPDFPT